MMEKKIRLMSGYFKKYGHHLHADRDVKTTLIAAELLRRLNDYRIVDRTQFHIKEKMKEDKLEKYYLDYFCKVFNKHLKGWWD
jgi:Holliday junction resolvasome RuvABC ATP-dependent DNA helicase subunit